MKFLEKLNSHETIFNLKRVGEFSGLSCSSERLSMNSIGMSRKIFGCAKGEKSVEKVTMAIIKFA